MPTGELPLPVLFAAASCSQVLLVLSKAARPQPPLPACQVIKDRPGAAPHCLPASCLLTVRSWTAKRERSWPLQHTATRPW